jgi:hypothetical protein
LFATSAQGTDISGQDFTFSAARGSGSGLGGSFIFKTAPAGASGAALNALVTRLTIDEQGQVNIAAPTSGIALTVNGKLTVTGAIDPTSVLLSGGTALYYESNDGSTAPVSGAATGRLRYNNSSGRWEVSTQTSAYTALLLSGGGVTLALTTQNGGGVGTTYAVLDTDFTILGDASGATFSAQLPTAVGRLGKMFSIKRINAGPNKVTVSSAGGTIDTVASWDLNVQFESVTVQSDGTDWWIV